jgi:hypothetical protein
MGLRGTVFNLGGGSSSGVWGSNTLSAGFGVTGSSSVSEGVYGTTAAGWPATGVYGTSTASSGATGVTGVATGSGSTGVFGQAATVGVGGVGTASNGIGVSGSTSGAGGHGVDGVCNGSCNTSNGWAGYFTGNVKVTGTINGVTVGNSDVRLKKNVNPLEGAVQQLLQLRGVTYEWKEPAKHANQTGTQSGFIAQDVEKVFPQWVSVDPDGFKLLNTKGLEALLVESVRTLKTENDLLKDRVKALEGIGDLCAPGSVRERWGWVRSSFWEERFSLPDAGGRLRTPCERPVDRIRFLRALNPARVSEVTPGAFGPVELHARALTIESLSDEDPRRS